MDRRNFAKYSGTIAVGSVLAPHLMINVPLKKRIAMVGTGIRGINMWGIPVIKEFSDIIEFVGLCDINPGRLQTAKDRLKLNCSIYTDFDKMMKCVNNTKAFR